MKATIITIAIGIALGIGGFFLSRSLAQNATQQNADGMLNAAPAQIIEHAQAFVLPRSQTTYMPIRDFAVADPIINARAAVLVDLQSGRSLYAWNADTRLPIASITKLMSGAVILEHLDLNKVYTVAAEHLNVDGTGADFVKGEQLRGTELFRIALMQSSNDAIAVFETYLQMEGVDLVEHMNRKAQQLGMVDTYFAEPAGLNDRETYSTATDVVKLVRYAMQYPLMQQALTTKQVSIQNKNVLNTNKLLGAISGIIFGKTGNTDGARGTMILVAGVSDTQDAVISVILGTEDRFGETKKLIDWGKSAHTW